MHVLIDRHRFGRLTALVFLLFLVVVLLPEPAQAGDQRARIKGTVVDAATKKAVKGVKVYVLKKMYPWGPTNPGHDHDWDQYVSGVTGKDGSYSIAVPKAGTYRVFFIPANRSRWAMEAYPNGAIPELGANVVVKAGKVKSGINVKLDPSNRIEGHIWDARSKWDSGGNVVDSSLWRPLAGIRVAAAFQGLVRINMHYGFPGLPLGQDTTDANGFYSIPGFKPYPFFVWAFDEDGVAPQFTDLIIGDETSSFPNRIKVLDAALQPTDFVNIRGRLVDEAGLPLAGKTILVYVSDTSPELPRPFCSDPDHVVTTDANGLFTCVHLPEPAALLSFEGDGEFREEFYDDREYDDAPPIAVNWGRTNDVGDWVISRRYASGP